LPPFFEDQEEPLFQQILNGHYDFPPEFWSEVSNNAKDIVRRLMTVDPQARMNVVQAKAHPWMMVELNILFQICLSSKSSFFQIPQPEANPFASTVTNKSQPTT